MKTQNNPLACPRCRAAIHLSADGNTVTLPVVCPVCSLSFAPHFYCPDARSPARHIFTAATLFVDSTGALYTFCPDHTSTTYSLTPDSRLRDKRTPFGTFVHLLDSLVFRLLLAIESWRWRLVSRR